MKISYTWLKEFLPGLKTLPTANPQNIANRLTLVGLEVEAIHDLSRKYAGIVVGEVLEKNSHPASDKLSVCRVSDGTETHTVVCGAPNVTAGKKYPFATLGTKFENGILIEKRKIRDVESSGMLCSASELDLSADSSGLLELNASAKTGMPFAKFYGLDDVVLEIGVTPNRGDCLSHLGVAREVASIYGLTLKPPLCTVVKGSAAKDLKVKNTAPKFCMRYTTRLIKNIRLSSSPQWLQNRLSHLGLRPINNIVDATNYVMLELGHPVHAFDASLVSGGVIKVATAKQLGISSFVTLDGVERKLEVDDLLIADSEKPIALAGIMGGANSGIGNATKDIVLEVAHFNPTIIRKTSRRLGLVTDSSQRFERFVSPESVGEAMNRLTNLILELAGGEASAALDIYPAKFKKLTLTLRDSFLESVTGVTSSSKENNENLKMFKALGFGGKRVGKTLKLTVPSYRSDVTREIDLAEEVVRSRGMDAIPAVLPQALMRTVYESLEEIRERTIRDYFVSQGFYENIHYSFTDPVLLEKFSAEASNSLKLINPISTELSVMRSSLIPQLLNTAQKNWVESEGVLRLFECRSVYEKPRREKKVFTALYAGNYLRGGLSLPVVPTDFYFGKKLIQDVIHQLGLGMVIFEKGNLPSYYHPLNAVSVKLAGETIGYLGALHPQMAESFGIGFPITLLELDLPVLNSLPKAHFTFSKLNPYPRVKRDLALVVDRGVTYESVLKAINSHPTNWLVDVNIFDIYQGNKIDSLKKSLSLSLVYESLDKTLTDEEVNRVHFELIDKLQESHGYLLR